MNFIFSVFLHVVKLGVIFFSHFCLELRISSHWKVKVILAGLKVYSVCVYLDTQRSDDIGYILMNLVIYSSPVGSLSLSLP